MDRKDTEQIYLEKGFNLTKRCLREAIKCSDKRQNVTYSLINPTTGNPERVMFPVNAIRWSIENHLSDWSPSTWRIYRNAYLHLLKKMAHDGIILQEDIDELQSEMKNVRAPKKTGTNTSSLREKKLSEDDYHKLIKDCEATCSSPNSEGRNKYDWGDSLKYWIISSVATGLRPNEWFTAELYEEDGKLLLKCENFKYNKERSYDKHRVIDLSSIAEDKKNAVKTHKRLIERFDAMGQGVKYYECCRGLLARLNKKLWPNRKKNIMLYTGRHQFSANAKASGKTSHVERAAMMGHKTTKTSSEGYGKTRSGSNGFTPEIADKNVLRKIRVPEIKRPTIFRSDEPKVVHKVRKPKR
jgi:hypothetical protein